MNNDLMFSSKDQTWETPQAIFNRLNLEFNFDLDAAAAADTAKCSNYFTKEDNALIQDWGRYNTVWLNPPYDQNTLFLEKAYKEALKGSIVVVLIPGRVDTRYYHDYCMRASEIRFIKGRLKFGNSKNSAPFPSILVIFNYHNWDGLTRISTYDKGILKLIRTENFRIVHFDNDYRI